MVEAKKVNQSTPKAPVGLVEGVSYAPTNYRSGGECISRFASYFAYI